MTVSSCSTHPHPRFIDNGYVQLVSVIGNGAYGVVFYALDYRYGRPIKRAVKQLRRHGIDDRQRRFQLREIALHRRASRHPSIINMDRLIEEPEAVYVVMDYGDEGDLFAMITEKQRYAGDNDLIRSVFLQILDGVDWLHQLGIAHRDVKPENIVCSADGTRVRIVDFGLATSESTSTEFGCGSTFYIAPECLGEWHSSAGSYPTRTADVWSLGVILVNLVCGRNPWRCASPTDESFAAFLQDPAFLRRILPISTGCLDILTQIFTLEPEHRISLDRLRHLIYELDSFTDDAATRAAAVKPPPVPPPVYIPAAPIDAAYYDSPVSDDAEPVFSFDDPELDTELPPALRADSGSLSPNPLQSSGSTSSNEERFPATPRLGYSGDHSHLVAPTPRVASVSSLTAPMFEALGQRKSPRFSPAPFATPAMFL
ncbi:hypothetical protein VHUM_00784 [Vanrija humicola]|uniref:Protein kinase domain-containing protein n=1 Tax=Vanrija humicola TaxID=5417 RepID=A0A7D8ZWY6_VANHU|nr:hypothetical protein VHUM_00784 [Vanrija humicola]